MQLEEQVGLREACNSSVCKLKFCLQVFKKVSDDQALAERIKKIQTKHKEDAVLIA